MKFIFRLCLNSVLLACLIACQNGQTNVQLDCQNLSEGISGDLKLVNNDTDAIAEHLRKQGVSEKKILQEMQQRATSYLGNMRIGDNIIQMVFDTGSANIILAASERQFGTVTDEKEDGIYWPGKDAINDLQEYTIAYGSGSAVLRGFQEKVSLPCEPIPKKLSRIGVIKKNENARNILGLAYDSIAVPSKDPPPSFMRQFAERGNKGFISFGFCGPSGGSKVAFGGHLPGQTDADFDYTPILEETYYVVQPKELKANGKVIGKFPIYNAEKKSGVMTIADTGGTMTKLPIEMHDSVVELMKSVNKTGGYGIPEGYWTATPKTPDLYARAIDPKIIAQFPTLILTFDNEDGKEFEYKIAPENYFKDFNNGRPTFGIIASEGVAVIGQSFIEAGTMAFDRDNKRVGFSSKSACN